MPHNISASVVGVWSPNLRSQRKSNPLCKHSPSQQPDAATALRSLMTAPPTQAIPVWSTASPVTTPTNVELAVATEKTCMPTQAACPIWLSQTLGATPTSLEPDPLQQPTMSQDIPATQNQMLTQMEPTCTTMRLRDTTASILPITQLKHHITATTYVISTITTR